MTNTTSVARSPQVSVRLDPALLTVVKRAAEQERRTKSNLLRNVIADWAARRREPGGRPA